MTLRAILQRIVTEAVEAHWDEISTELAPLVVAQAQQIDNWRLGDMVSGIAQRAIEGAVQRHLETTYAPEINAMAKEKARRQVEKRQKAMGLVPVEETPGAI